MSLRPDRGPEAGRHWGGPVVVGIGPVVDDWLLGAAAEEAADRRCGVRLVHVRHDPIAIYGQADIAVPVRWRESESQGHERLIASRDRLLSIAPAGALIAVQLVTEAGDVAAGIARHCGDASVAMIGVDRGQRHRLNRVGDRDANRTLYMITISRMRYCPDTRAYIERRQAEGLSKREAIRCVKRYIARQTFHTIRADLASIRTLDSP